MPIIFRTIIRSASLLFFRMKTSLPLLAPHPPVEIHYKQSGRIMVHFFLREEKRKKKILFL